MDFQELFIKKLAKKIKVISVIRITQSTKTISLNFFIIILN